MPLSSTQSGFLRDAVAAARAAAPAGVPAWAPVAVAQAILESDWGRRRAAQNNVFGIKATGGEPAGAPVDTTEYVGGKPVRVQARFRAYPSLAAAFADHARLTTQTSVYKATRAHPRDPEGFARALAGTYATDPAYARKVLDVLRAYDLPALFGFVAGSSGAGNPGAPPATKPGPSAPAGGGGLPVAAIVVGLLALLAAAALGAHARG